MCGGVAVNTTRVSQEDLAKFFTKQEIEQFKKTGEIQSFFWSRVPVLPIEINNKVELMEWGNRDKQLKLPRTAWAKEESIAAGKWYYLHPQEVKILADRGYEKGIWFDVPGGGFKGIIVELGDKKRIYMVTKPADEDYKDLTKHDRQPVESD